MPGQGPCRLLLKSGNILDCARVANPAAGRNGRLGQVGERADSMYKVEEEARIAGWRHLRNAPYKSWPAGRQRPDQPFRHHLRAARRGRLLRFDVVQPVRVAKQRGPQGRPCSLVVSQSCRSSRASHSSTILAAMPIARSSELGLAGQQYLSSHTRMYGWAPCMAMAPASSFRSAGTLWIPKETASRSPKLSSSDHGCGICKTVGVTQYKCSWPILGLPWGFPPVSSLATLCRHCLAE